MQLAEVKGDISSSKQLIAEGDRTIAAARGQMAATAGAAAAAEAREEAANQKPRANRAHDRTEHQGRAENRKSAAAAGRRRQR